MAIPEELSLEQRPFPDEYYLGDKGFNTNRHIATIEHRTNKLVKQYTYYKSKRTCRTNPIDLYGILDKCDHATIAVIDFFRFGHIMPSEAQYLSDKIFALRARTKIMLQAHPKKPRLDFHWIKRNDFHIRYKEDY